MPTKMREDPHVQQDRHRRPHLHDTDQPRSFDAAARVHDVNADTSPTRDPVDDINTQGSER